MVSDEVDLQAEMAGHVPVFVGGLHRSGTTFLAAALSATDHASGLTGTGARKDEGQSLQDVYTGVRFRAGPGRFGFRAENHLTEASPLLVDGAAERVWRAWRPYWDLEKRFVVEKSPPNIVRMRFLQALFPGSRFVVIVRHPIAVSLATRKWCRATHFGLVRHWVNVHRILAEDLPHLQHVTVIRYEDLVDDFPSTWAGLLTFLGHPPATAPRGPKTGMNDHYYQWWDSAAPVGTTEHALIAARYESAAARLGYSFRAPYVTGPVAAPFSWYRLPVAEPTG